MKYRLKVRSNVPIYFTAELEIEAAKAPQLYANDEIAWSGQETDYDAGQLDIESVEEVKE